MANILRTVVENDKGELRKLEKIAKKVESYADAMAALSDEELKAKTPEFKQRYQNGETLDQLLPEAFAVVREAAKRVLDFIHTVFKSWVVLLCTMVTCQKCVLVKVNIASFMPVYPHLQVKVFTLSLLMNTLQHVTRLKWVKFIAG